MKQLISLFIIIILYSVSLSAQSAGGGLMLGFPEGEFKQNVDRPGFGLSGQVLFFNPSEGSSFRIRTEYRLSELRK